MILDHSQGFAKSVGDRVDDPRQVGGLGVGKEVGDFRRRLERYRRGRLSFMIGEMLSERG